MKNILKKVAKNPLSVVILLAIIIAQALWILKLKTEDKAGGKLYEVNLMPIKNERDSVDFLQMRSDLADVDQYLRSLNNLFAAKKIPNEKLQKLSTDSLASAVYLARSSQRYSRYLAELQEKLLQTPLGMPADGYVSSNFGLRKNPIPPKDKDIKPAPEPAKPTEIYPEERDSLGNIIPGKIAAQKPTGKSKAEGKSDESEPEQMQFHKGMDIAVPYGSDVRCTAEGTVIFAGVKGGYGNCVIVSHKNGLATLYGHLSQILTKVNDEVKVGEVIAKTGNSGRSTGPHLHYEVHRNGTPVNPKLFLN